MPASFRYEYYWSEGRVVERRISRPLLAKRWPFETRAPSLIAVIEPTDNSFELRRGPAATNQRIVDAVRHYEKVYADVTIPDLGADVPRQLVENIAKTVHDLTNKYTQQYRSFANEEDITGFIKGLIHGTMIEQDGWRATIKTWTYARNPKERQLGIDIGIIIDILVGDQRIIKALWVQAKRSENNPRDILKLPDLMRQFEDMQRHTKEAYALVYTAEGAQMYRAEHPSEPLSVDSVIFDSIICRRGDRDPTVVALTADSKVILQLFVTGPMPPNPGQADFPDTRRGGRSDAQRSPSVGRDSASPKP